MTTIKSKTQPEKKIAPVRVRKENGHYLIHAVKTGVDWVERTPAACKVRIVSLLL